jgi:hypothetical protein
MALWDAPTTATVVGDEKMAEASSLGLRTVSRSRRLKLPSVMGTGTVAGEEPVQRMRRVAETSTSSWASRPLIRTVHERV